MSIASEITRLQGCKTDIRTALVNKGVTAAATHNMANFAADITSIVSGGATITITYNSSFYNKTMTCTKGTTTYTKTTTSSGRTEFTVKEGGTWTITCNGTSTTVDVVLNYSKSMSITKTITVTSAASDTVSFTDATGAKTVTTDTTGIGSVTITFIPGKNITFTSAVAKNPNNLSNAYTKTITFNANTTSIKVMPDGALYWYGWNGGKLVQVTAGNGWSGTYNENLSAYAVSWGTNSFSWNISDNNDIGVSNNVLYTPGQHNYLKAIGYRDVNPGYLCAGPQKKIYTYMTGSQYTSYDTSTSTVTVDLRNITTNYYIGITQRSRQHCGTYAVWFE